MLARKLIEELQKHDPEMEVMMLSEDVSWEREVYQVSVVEREYGIATPTPRKVNILLLSSGGEEFSGYE